MEGATNQDHVIGIPVNSTAYGIEEPDFPEVEEAITPPDHGGFVSGSFQSINNNDGDSNGSTATDRDQTSQVRRKRGKIAQGIKEHVTLGPKLSETVKGKLTLGARILQAGGVEKVFRQWFSVDKNERLVTIPLRKVRRAVPTENKHKPEQRYIEVLTNDGFEFWFMGFVSYHRSLQHLEQAIVQARR
ncbi:unnamed protein product [Triticum turgidum subsp. durum]|uniref:GRAM domain-containing protein n=1 Tax=Triticum turgidum subsp. durum TaxID=4567 RepID=A0A9R0YQ15_TRITD|nr:unnamed protein product [Triticum turgidum subsp. durum]